MVEGETELSNRIYLDYAATAPLEDCAFLAMMPFFREHYGNASTLYSEGRDAFQHLEEARKQVSEGIGAAIPSEVIFTSGGTESDFLALAGIAFGARRSGRTHGKPGKILISAIEHHAVMETAKNLRAIGFEVIRIPCDHRGIVNVSELERLMDDQVALVCVMAANNVVGSIQPIRELAACAHSYGSLFFTDAVQAFGKTPFHVQNLGIDAASISSHKLGGPKGVGALYLKTGTPYMPWEIGGGQEHGKRGGTQNVTGAVGFAAVVSQSVSELEAERKRLSVLGRYLLDGIRQTVPHLHPVIRHADETEDLLPNIHAFYSDYLDSETMVLRLDAVGFAVSGGSACSSRSLDPDPVLKAMGFSDRAAQGLLRISFGRKTSMDEIDALLDILPVALL